MTEKKKQQSKKRQFEVLKGFDVGEDRYEAGDVISLDDTKLIRVLGDEVLKEV